MNINKQIIFFNFSLSLLSFLLFFFSLQQYYMLQLKVGSTIVETNLDTLNYVFECWCFTPKVLSYRVHCYRIVNVLGEITAEENMDEWRKNQTIKQETNNMVENRIVLDEEISDEDRNKILFQFNNSVGEKEVKQSEFVVKRFFIPRVPDKDRYIYDICKVGRSGKQVEFISFPLFTDEMKDDVKTLPWSHAKVIIKIK